MYGMCDACDCSPLKKPCNARIETNENNLNFIPNIRFAFVENLSSRIR